MVAKAADIQRSIDEGATAFLATEYYYLSIFMVRSGLAELRARARTGVCVTCVPASRGLSSCD